MPEPLLSSRDGVGLAGPMRRPEAIPWHGLGASPDRFGRASQLRAPPESLACKPASPSPPAREPGVQLAAIQTQAPVGSTEGGRPAEASGAAVRRPPVPSKRVCLRCRGSRLKVVAGAASEALASASLRPRSGACLKAGPRPEARQAASLRLPPPPPRSCVLSSRKRPACGRELGFRLASRR